MNSWTGVAAAYPPVGGFALVSSVVPGWETSIKQSPAEGPNSTVAVAVDPEFTTLTMLHATLRGSMENTGVSVG